MKFRAYSLEEILSTHEQIAKGVLSKVRPLDYFQDYLHHGFYPFFLEKRNFSENLLKTMNMMVEVDILLIKQIELKYLSKIKNSIFARCRRAESSKCEPTGKRHTDISRHGDELYQVSGRCATH